MEVGIAYDLRPAFVDGVGPDVAPPVPRDSFHEAPGSRRPSFETSDHGLRSTWTFSPLNSFASGSHGKKMTTLNSTRSPLAG